MNPLFVTEVDYEAEKLFVTEKLVPTFRKQWLGSEQAEDIESAMLRK
ncbi:MAG: hypothetical protein R3C59_30380 [Planctomycetaceae bacterium]